MQWDSGAGYNSYEQEQFHFLPTRSRANIKHQVILEGGYAKNTKSSNSRVVLSEIRIDDKGVPIPENARTEVRFNRGAGMFLESVDSRITLNVLAKERIYFFLKANSSSGIAKITIDGNETKHDLFRSNWAVQLLELDFWFLDEEGSFSVSTAIPRYAIDKVRIKVPKETSISSIYLESKKGRIIKLPLVTEEGTGDLLIRSPTHHLKHYYHKSKILFQILFALVMAWGTLSLLKFTAAYGGIREFFLGEKLRSFWLFFGCAALFLSLWLLAFWPGILSVDSLNIWRAAWLPEVMINDHPALNVVWYMFLLHIWNNVAVVPLSQIFLLSVLLAAVFYFCHRQGIRLYLLLPCYFLLLFSLPVGLYTITLWKDVPFALLVVFWSLTLPYYYLRKNTNNRNRLSLGQIGFLLIMFLALIFFRHNGLVYLFVIPLLLVTLQIVRIPRVYMVFGGIVILLLTLLVVSPPKSMKSASYFHDLSSSYLKDFTKDSVTTRVTQSIKLYPRLLDIRKNQNQSDLWHYFLRDRYAYNFLRQSGWNDSHKYISSDEYPFSRMRSFALKLYEKSYEYPLVYFSWNPFLLLYLFPLSILLCRWFPLSAIFSSVILVQVLALLIFVETVNWRYYYFVLLGGYFLLPILLLDWHRLYLRTSAKGMNN